MDFDAISIESRWRRAVCRVKWKWKKEKLKKRPFSILEIPSFWGTVTQDCFPFLNHQCFFWKLNSTTEIWGKNEFSQSFLGDIFGSFHFDLKMQYTPIIADWPSTYIWNTNSLLHLEFFLCCEFGRTLKNHLRNQWLKMSWFILVWNLCDCCDVG